MMDWRQQWSEGDRCYRAVLMQSNHGVMKGRVQMTEVLA